MLRTVTLDDLTRHRHARSHALAPANVRSLVRRGFLRVRTLHFSKAVYAAFTREGKEFRNRPKTQGNQQKYHAHFVQSRELRHEVAIYPWYQEVAAQIARDGANVRRLVLDFELKRSINPRLTKLQPLPPADRERLRQEIAHDNGLTVVDGKIPFPELWIEYENAERNHTKVDVELPACDCDRDGNAAKARAGFSICALHEDVGRPRRALEDPELTKEISAL